MGVCDSTENKHENITEENKNIQIEANPKFQARESTKFFPTNNHSSNQSNLILSNDVIISDSGFNPETVYQKIKLLGEGSFGEVWQVRHKTLGKDFAMKIIEKSPNCNVDEIKNEIEILKQLDHPNILKILEFHMSTDKFYIITDYCSEGELFHEIKSKELFSEMETAYVIKQILSAVRYCHKMRVIHRDIKPENIMIIRRELGNYLHIKLIDFGTAKFFDEGNIQRGLVGSSYYIAPEVIKRKYDEKCDIWSIGVIMYIMLTGIPPFYGSDDESILLHVSIGKYDTTSDNYLNLSDDAKDLIKNLLKFNPKERITARNALEHPWFKSKQFTNLYHRINTVKMNDAREMLNNVENYRSNNIIKCAVLAYLVHQNINMPQCIEATKLFNEIDLNQDGKLEPEEIEYAYVKYYGMKPVEAKRKRNLVFRNIDTDNNGFIEIEEFIRACINPGMFTSDNQIKAAFDYFDIDRSGTISINEIELKFYQNSKNKNEKTKRLIKNLFDEIDTDQDGEISFSEFSSMIKNIFSK
jgi:calcium-dependent protein kinase